MYATHFPPTSATNVVAHSIAALRPPTQSILIALPFTVSYTLWLFALPHTLIIIAIIFVVNAVVAGTGGGLAGKCARKHP